MGGNHQNSIEIVAEKAQNKRVFDWGIRMFSRKDLSKLILPLIVEQLLAVTVGMADTVMVASCGEAAVSGVSLVDSINLLLINVFAALATGGAIVASQYLGREDHDNAGHAAKQLILVTAVASTAIMIICLVGRNFILRGLFGNVDDEVMRNCQIYLFYSALSYPFIAVYNAGAALFRAMGNSKVSMFASLLMNVINISGNALLIFKFKMGVAGAAIPSLISRMVAAIFILWLLKNKQAVLEIGKLHKLEFNPTMVKNILRIGVPNGLENGMFQIGKILVQGLIASFGTVSIAANAVSNSVASISLIPGTAIGLALVTVVGQCVGAGNYEEAKKYILKLTALTYVAIWAVDITIALLVHPAVGFFNLQPETASIAVKIILAHCAVSVVLWPASFTLPNGLRASNDVRFTMLTSLISMWVFRIGFSYILGRYCGMGVFGTWVAMFIDWAVRSACFIIRLVSGKWKEKKFI